MLHDINNFFGGVTPQGAIVLLLIGLFSGFGLHDMMVWSYVTTREWYAARHGRHSEH